MTALHDLVLSRLDTSGHANASWALLLLAALEGDSALTGFLDRTATNAPTTSRAAATDSASKTEAPGVFVSSVSVSGFRGIGAAATLSLKPGPGLTLVVGRNGSGKSSFAEALECLFTGTSSRWEGRTASWKTGWKNLHDAGTPSLKADLIVEGQGALRLSRAWSSDVLADASTVVSAKGKKDRPLAALGWDASLAAFRPFLSYNELGTMLDEGPSKLYDALSSVLGLDELTAVQTRLANARKARETIVTASKNGAKELAQRLAATESNDDRFGKALVALTAKTADLGALDRLAVGEAAPEENVVGRLRQIATLAAPDVQVVGTLIERLRSAERACAKVAGTNAQRARQRADLLEAALTVHAAEPSPDCPVCGAKKRLSDAWLRSTQMEIAALREEASGFDAASQSRRAAVSDAQRVITQPPAILAQSTLLGLSTLVNAREQWAVWGTGRDMTDASALADHLEQHVLALADAVTALTSEAHDEGRKRDDTWRQAAASIVEWLSTARKAQAAQGAIADLKQAETWWKEVSEELRNERFAPIAKKAMDTWQQLRLQSNVDLGDIDLEGTGVRRKVALRVTVDGTPSEAAGVMSQGELHALALSLFLPRATLPESPFRFIAIDDPVQSMDPSRVDGLARVLGDAAKTRQVIVFTHDDRLPEAVRRLGIPAAVIGVSRRERSVVDLRNELDPVQAYLDDARAVAKTSELSPTVIARVVPGFCRAALEAVCVEKVRARRLGKGVRHEEVEQLLLENGKTHPLMALALFDDEKRTGDVLARLNKFGSWAADAFRDCKEGAHEAHAEDVLDLIDATKRLTVQLRSLQ